MNRSRRSWLWLVLLSSAALAQGPPRLQAVFPAGGRAGSTVDVVLRGGLSGASQMFIYGEGVSGELQRREGASDANGRRLFNQKCATCHELRSPANRQMAPPQWEATVDRMINQRGADINAADRKLIVDFLRAEAAAGVVLGKVTIAADAKPGLREIRVLTAAGVSTAFPFYVSGLPETVEQEPNDTLEQARELSLPAVVNGCCERPGDRDYVRFSARRGQRLLLRATAYRLNQDSQSYFSACLYLYNAAKQEIAANLGFEDLDPLIDFTVPDDGVYTLECRDLLYRGGAANVYRLEVGELGYRQSIYPLGGQRGAALQALVTSENQPHREWQTTLAADQPLGLQEFDTPFGLFRFHVSAYPDILDSGESKPQNVRLPCVINGWLGRPGEADRYVLSVPDSEPQVVRRWMVVGPFDGQDIGGLERAFDPEREILGGRFDPARQFSAKGGQEGWEAKDADATTGVVGLPAGTNEVWYGLYSFESRQEAYGLLSIGSDDGCKVWLNGSVVHSFKGNRPARLATDLVPVRFRRGPNIVLLKVFNASGPGGLGLASGAQKIDVFARRLGSPLKPVLKLGFGTRWLFQSTNDYDFPQRPGGDVRCDWSFAQGGEYGLQLEDADGAGGERYAYRIEIGPAQPSATLKVFPANPSLPPGGAVPLVVERSSLSGYAGDLRLVFEGLPAGVTVDDAVLPADVPSTVVVLRAAAAAKPAATALRVYGEVPSLSGPQRFEATPQDFYRIQNNAFPISRRGLVAAVTEEAAPYTLTASPASVPVRPGQKAELTVTVDRRPGFNQDINLILMGLPPNVSGTSTVIRADRRSATLELNFSGNLRNSAFGQSRVADAYRVVAVGLNGGDGLSGGTMYCSQPIVLEPYDPTREPRQATPPATAGGARPAPNAGEAAGRMLLERRCVGCHALYDPEETKKSLADWTATVDRMIQKGARVSNAERDQILTYLRAVTARQTR
ncbi:MAG: hypothetical protein IT204_24815 [Fimbriimonadaceae bacterium]|nr:hypothetical protein [Fimbriimonadaceae bacterium]